MAERPRSFSINRGHTLARDLVFAGLGNPGGVISTHYQDSSFYRKHGTLTNMDPSTDWVWVPQLGRWALDFDGNDDRVDLFGPHLSGDFTCSMKWNMAAYTNIFITGDFNAQSGASGWAIRTNSTNLQFALGGAGGFEYVTLRAGAPQDGKWHAVTVCCHQSLSKLYFYYDGEPVASINTSKTITPSTAPFRIGCANHSISPLYFVAATISDVMLWKRVLSGTEAAILADPSNALLSGLLLPPKRRYWAIPTPAATGVQLGPWQHEPFAAPWEPGAWR